MAISNPFKSLKFITEPSGQQLDDLDQINKNFEIERSEVLNKHMLDLFEQFPLLM